jgi:UDP-N-acetylglucosamine 2-epimerase (non-hydrolysing)
LVLGDTNSGLDAILPEKMGIPVIHMEAGNRCFDLEVHEEKNDVLLMRFLVSIYPVLLQSKENLGKEGIPKILIILS